MFFCLSERGGEGRDCLVSLTVVERMPIRVGELVDNGCCCDLGLGGGCDEVLGGG